MLRALSFIPSLFFGAFATFILSPAIAADSPAISIENEGTGDPILFIPGLSSGGDIWDTIAGDLSADYKTHVATLAGFAGMPPIEGPFLETRLEGLVDYLADNDLKNVTVVGHSLGGAMAMMLALEAPDRVSRVVIVDSVPFLGQFFLGVANAEAAEPGAAAMRDQLIQLTDEQYEAQQRQFAATQARDKDQQDKILTSSLASDRSTVARVMYELLTTDLRPRLPDIKAKMLVLYAFRAGGPFTAEQIDGAYAGQYADAKSAKLTRIDDSAHFIMLDQPNAVIDVIRSFLKE